MAYFAPATTQPAGRRRGAELVFIESPYGGEWNGRLVARDAAIDRQTGQPAHGPYGRRYIAKVVEAQGTGGVVLYVTTTQGPAKGSRRYGSYRTLAAAQAALVAWARRRFYVVAS